MVEGTTVKGEGSVQEVLKKLQPGIACALSI
jgi:hypothetical protein